MPQDREKPSGLQVQLPFAILKSFQGKPLPDSVIHLHGGPAGSSLLFADEGVQVFRTLREKRDVVLFDQRGGGLAKPNLNCYNIDFDPASAQAENVPEGFNRNRARTLLACANAFKAKGIDLAKYNTAENARDVVDLARALGLRQFNLTSVSYGTRLAQEVMRLNPAGLRSIVLDSSLSPATKSYEDYYIKGWRVIEAVFADCARDAACNKAYPNLKERTLRLLKNLDRSPAQVKQAGLDFKLDGYTLMKPLMYAGDVPEVVPYIPRLIDEVEKGKFDTFLDIQDGRIDKLLPAHDDVVKLDPASPAGALDAAIRDRLEALGDNANSARSDWYDALGELKGRAALREVIQKRFANSATELLALLARLNDADLEDLYRANRVVRGSARELGPFKAYECHDSYPFNDPAKVVLNAKNLPFIVPSESLEETRLTIQECQFWPTGVADTRITQPVTSASPVLILQGRSDFVTPAVWGQTVATQLSESTYVEIGMSGHGTMKYSQCARDLASAFIDAPLSSLDTTCVSKTPVIFKLPAH